MTITRDELLSELRELFEAARELRLAKDLYQEKGVSPRAWKCFNESVDRARAFLEEVDGPRTIPTCASGGPCDAPGGCAPQASPGGSKTRDPHGEAERPPYYNDT